MNRDLIARPGMKIVCAGVNTNETDHTGLTRQVWIKRTIESICSVGLYLEQDAISPFEREFVPWEKLWMWRIYVVRRGRSARNKFNTVERHWLYKINLKATQDAYSEACRIAIKLGKLNPQAEQYHWRENDDRKKRPVDIW